MFHCIIHQSSRLGTMDSIILYTSRGESQTMGSIQLFISQRVKGPWVTFYYSLAVEIRDHWSHSIIHQSWGFGNMGSILLFISHWDQGLYALVIEIRHHGVLFYYSSVMGIRDHVFYSIFYRSLTLGTRGSILLFTSRWGLEAMDSSLETRMIHQLCGLGTMGIILRTKMIYQSCVLGTMGFIVRTIMIHRSWGLGTMGFFLMTKMFHQSWGLGTIGLDKN